MNPHPTEREAENARRKFKRHSVIYMLAFGVYVAGECAYLWLGREHRASALGVACSVIAYTALGFSLWRGERDLMQSEDELQQKIRTEALAHALPFTIGLACLFLRLIELGFDDGLLRPILIWPWLLAPYSIALLLARRRYS